MKTEVITARDVRRGDLVMMTGGTVREVAERLTGGFVPGTDVECWVYILFTDGGSVDRDGDRPMVRVTGAYMSVCHDTPVARHHSEAAAKAWQETHILTCDKGEMPWATSVEWTHGDGIDRTGRTPDEPPAFSARQGGWLNHHILILKEDNVSDEEAPG